MIPADSGLAQPATVTIPSALLSHGMDRNRIIGGDFTTNLWQRGNTPVSNATPTVATMAADRWWVISPAGTVDVLKTTPASTAADYLGASGFYNGMEVRRHTGSTGALTCVGQTLDQNAAAPLIGNNAVFSFYGYAPASYSASNENVTVSVAYFTASDAAGTQAAIGDAGGNSSTFALSAAAQSGGITGYQAAVTAVSVNGAGASVASGVATIPLTTTPTRYAVVAPIPAATSAGTAITAVGISICGTFTATTSVTTDWFEIFAAQLEAKPSAATASLPNGVVSPTGFERRNAQDEANLQLAYSYIVNEIASSSSAPHGVGVNASTTVANVVVPFPVWMRIVPAAKYTAGFGAYGNTTPATNACTGLATVTNGLKTNQSAYVGCTVASGLLAGYPSNLIDDGGAGVMSFSAEP